MNCLSRRNPWSFAVIGIKKVFLISIFAGLMQTETDVDTTMRKRNDRSDQGWLEDGFEFFERIRPCHENRCLVSGTCHMDRLQLRDEDGGCAMMLNSIHHIAIICSDRNKALDFYVNRLGFPVIRENYRPERNDWKIDLKLNDTTELELFIVPNSPGRPSYPEAQGLRHLAFRVASVPDTAAWLKERGIDCEPMRLDAYTSEAMTFFHDPDGLPIEIHE